MPDQPQPTGPGPSAAPPNTALRRIGTTALAIFLLAFGGALAALMAVALITEYWANDIFGVGLSFLVLTFALQLVSKGRDLWAGKASSAETPDPATRSWESCANEYPYLPYSRFRARIR